MRWALLLLLLVILLWPLRPSAPDPDQTARAVRDALNAELAEPFSTLATQLPVPDGHARQRLEKLSHALFTVENVTLAASESATDHWRGRLEADIVCALPSDSAELRQREALAFAMAYRTICPVAALERVQRHVVRNVLATRRDGRWIAELSPDTETNP